MGFGHIKDKIAYYSRHNFLLRNRIRQIREASELDPAVLEERQGQIAMQLIRHAVARSGFYRKLYSSVNLNAPFREVYPLLPVIQKADVKANTLKMVTAPLRLLKKAHTSGTSGSPLEVYRSFRSILNENAYVWYYRMQHGLNMGDPIVSMRGVLDNKTFHYLNKAENTLYLSSYLLSAKNIHKYAELLNTFKPKAICAFPSSVFTLVNLMNEAGLKTTIPLIFTSSETLYAFQREKIENGLDGKIFDWYGNAERSISLGQCEQGNYHELPLYGMNNFLEKGVITTSLTNNAFPLIRYYVDDNFTLMSSQCSCGRGIGVQTIEGRVDDVVILPDGTHVGRLGVVFQGINNLRYAQIVQDSATEIQVNIVTTPQFNGEDQTFLLSKLRQRLNSSLAINFNKVEEDDIIKSASGKFKLIVSRIAENG